MSVSNPSGSQPKTSLELRSSSIKEQIQETLNAIQTIVQSTQIGHSPSPLHSQIILLKKEGFNPQIISQAMVVSKVSIATILGENRPLTPQELDLVLASCRDLTEASGSGSSSQPTTQSMKRKQLEEEISRSPSPKRSRLLQESTLQTEDILTEPASSQHAAEESLRAQSLNCLLVTIMKNEGCTESYQFMCPRKNPMQKEDEHQCELCELTKITIRESKYLLIHQLRQLMNETDQKILLKALLKLYKEEKLSELKTILYFPPLEITHLIKECNLEKIFPEAKGENVSKLLGVYQAVKNVVSLGIQHPLTALIIQIWKSTTPIVGTKTPILAISENEEISSLSPTSFLPTLCSIPQRKLSSGGKRRRLISPHCSMFLARIIITTLHAIKASPQGTPYMVRTNFGEKAFPWKIIRHLIGFVLSSHDKWMLQPPTNKLCLGSSEKIRFPEEKCLEILELQKKFVLSNHIIYPKTPPKIPQNVLLPEESLLLSTPLVQLEQTSSTSEQILEGISCHARPETTPQQSVIFMLEAILSEKILRATNVRCPNKNKDPSSRHLCSLCLFAKKLFCKRKARMVAQIRIFLRYTNKDTLVSALLNLPLGRTVEKLLDQTVFSPLDLAYLINLCNIGEDMRLPEKKNPVLLVDLYHSMEKVILGGLEDPLTKIIYTIWRQSLRSSLSFKEKEDLLITALWGSDVRLIDLQVIINYFSDLEFQFLETRKSETVRRRKGHMSSQSVKFHSLLAIITLQELKNCEEACPYLVTSLQDCILPKETVLHVYSLVLASTPRRKLIVTPSKASFGQMQELGFPKETANILLEALQEFATKNYLSIHSLK
ncbi:hypothetical protein [Chlamydiifrater volucris]|uniref:hypothetical protein n=2 Tax=Chlamydiifrater volucris TaxID=2681470 RepID=UPI001BCBA073|nr:hypothetical protein [Chlamydiifrater volucris]